MKRGEIEPVVTVIITAYNEERDIRGKLENTMLIDYPKEKLEIIVVSDHSTDSTDEIVRSSKRGASSFFGSRRAEAKPRRQNSAVETASGEIILFSDGTSMYEPRYSRYAAEFC